MRFDESNGAVFENRSGAYFWVPASGLPLKGGAKTVREHRKHRKSQQLAIKVHFRLVSAETYFWFAATGSPLARTSAISERMA